MSIRTVTGIQGNRANRAGTIPCVGGGGGDQKFGQSGVRQNETIQMIFPGGPPFNLTQNVCDVKGNCWCGAGPMINLTTNSYNWTVGGFKSNLPTFTGQPDVLFGPDSGHFIIWVAIEQHLQNTSDGLLSPYYASPNFSYSTTSYDRSASRGSTQTEMMGNLGLAGWGVMWLAVLSLLMGM